MGLSPPIRTETNGNRSHGWNVFHPENMKMCLFLTSLRDWGSFGREPRVPLRSALGYFLAFPTENFHAHSPGHCDLPGTNFRAVGHGAFPVPETVKMQPRILHLRPRMKVPGVGKSYLHGRSFACGSG